MVSIHAPAGGATFAPRDISITFDVSIHAPAGGATWIKFNDISQVAGFNPRARGGRDQTIKKKKEIKKMFQSTRPRGARLKFYFIHSQLLVFQSTRPRGARLLSIYALNSQYITYTISRTFSFASLLIYYSIYFFCKYFITRFCDPTSFLATLHVRVH